MKLIKLTQGKFAQVDDSDYEWLNQWKWCATKDTNTYYAQRSIYNNGKYFSIRMHRLILGVTDPKILIDHKDHNGLNCQRHNIRKCNSTQNSMNRSSHGNSNYLGINFHIAYKRYFSKKRQKTLTSKSCSWQARIKYNGKRISLGHFKTEEEAARAYDTAAKEYFGEFANLNFK